MDAEYDNDHCVDHKEGMTLVLNHTLFCTLQKITFPGFLRFQLTYTESIL